MKWFAAVAIALTAIFIIESGRRYELAVMQDTGRSANFTALAVVGVPPYWTPCAAVLGPRSPTPDNSEYVICMWNGEGARP